MEDIKAVGKDALNKTQGFKYRSIDAVMNALNPAMIKHKIFCAPEVIEQIREERTTGKGSTLIYSVCKIRYRFFTVDGSYIDAVVVGEGMDSGDKATNTAIFCDISHEQILRLIVAHLLRYCLIFQVLHFFQTIF